MPGNNLFRNLWDSLIHRRPAPMAAEPGAIAECQRETMSSPDLVERVSRNQTLLLAAHPHIQRLFDMVGPDIHLLGLIDSSGVMLNASRGGLFPLRNPGVLAEEGSCWNEESAGPNGPGTAVSTGYPSCVRGRTHSHPALQPFASIGIPIRDGSGCLTAALVVLTPPGPEEVRVLELARLTAIAIEQRLSFEGEKHAIARTARAEVAATLLQSYADVPLLPGDDVTIDSLARTARVFTTAESLTSICAALLTELVPFIPVTSIVIFEPETLTDRLVARAAAGLPDSFLHRFSSTPSRGVVGRTFTTGETFISDDLWNDPRIQHKEFLIEGGLRALMALPLKYHETCIGVLAVYSGATGVFTPHSETASNLLTLIETFAAQATLAMLSTRPREQLNRVLQQLGLLQETGLALQSALQSDEFAREIVRGALLVFESKWAFFCHVDSQGDALTIRQYASSGRDEQMSGRLLDAALHQHKPMLKWILSQRSVMRVDDLAKHFPESGHQLDGHGLGLSLYGRADEPLGYLFLWRPASERLFSEFDQYLLTALGVQAGLALENTTLLVRSRLEGDKLKAIIEAMTDGVSVVDHEGVTLQINGSALEQLGMAASEILGRRFGETLCSLLSVGDETGTPVAAENLPSSCALNGQPAQGTYRIVTRNGERRFLFASASPLFQPGSLTPWGTVTIWHDVTSATEAREMQANLMQVATHELRNPIAVLEAYLTLLEDERFRSKPSKLSEGLATLRHNVARVRRMANSFYDLLKLGTGQVSLKRRFGTFHEFVTSLTPELRVLAAGKDLDLTLDLCEDRGGSWDHSLLEQVMLNLVGNSVKFTSAGGKIELSSCEEDRLLHVTVADTGVGIPAQHVTDVFKQFYRVPEHVTRCNQEGSGLGLSISKEIVEHHGGQIWVTSDGDDRGTIVHFTLPLDLHNDVADSNPGSQDRQV